MELTENHSESFLSRDGSTMEAIDLLEECWFFDNLLNTKVKMPRCYSDLGPSTGLARDELKISHCSSFMSSSTKAHEKNGSLRSKLTRAPSLPPCRVMEEEHKKTSEFEKSSRLSRRQSVSDSSSTLFQLSIEKQYAQLKGLQKINDQCSSRTNKLHRTPSLPPHLGREETTMATGSRLIRQASLHQSGVMSSRHIPKVPRCSSSRLPKSSEIESTESLNTDGFKEMRRRCFNQGKTKKSLNELECEEVQGFKDLGFSFEKEALDPTVVSILPGLQDKKEDSSEEENKAVRRPYLSEAWLVQSCAPSIPKWDSKKSPENMKSHIRFWARTVASNVWQEC